MKFKIFVPLAASAAMFAAPAGAAVVTSGCTATDECTLEELFAGGSIAVDDVNLGSFVFDSAASDSNQISLDPANVTVSGSSTSTTATFDFVFDPVLFVFNDGDFLDFAFDYAASIVGSMRSITDVALSFAGFGFSTAFNGDFAFIEVLTNLNGGANELGISVDSEFGFVESDVESMLDLSSLMLRTVIGAEAVGGTASAQVQSFRLTFTLDGSLPPMPEIPVPAAFPLMLMGLAGLGLYRRRARGEA